MDTGARGVQIYFIRKKKKTVLSRQRNWKRAKVLPKLGARQECQYLKLSNHRYLLLACEVRRRRRWRRRRCRWYVSWSRSFAESNSVNLQQCWKHFQLNDLMRTFRSKLPAQLFYVLHTANKLIKHNLYIYIFIYIAIEMCITKFCLNIWKSFEFSIFHIFIAL